MNNNKQKAADSTPAKDNTFRSGLTPIQEKAAIMLANGDSVTLVAETLNVNRTTIYQWQQKVTFQCFFNIQKIEVTQNLQNGLAALYQEAIKAVKDILRSENEAMRLKSAMVVISKVESATVGETDAKEVFRQQATETINPFINEVILKPEKVLDQKQYRQLLKENGLED